MLDEDYWSWQILLTLRRWDGSPATPLRNVQADPHWKSLPRLPDVPLDRNFDLMAAEHYALRALHRGVLRNTRKTGRVRATLAESSLIWWWRETAPFALLRNSR